MVQESLKLSIATIIGNADDWDLGHLDDLHESRKTTSVAGAAPIDFIHDYQSLSLCLDSSLLVELACDTS